MKWTKPEFITVLQDLAPCFIEDKCKKGGRSLVLSETKQKIEEIATKNGDQLPDDLDKVLRTIYICLLDQFILHCS